MKKLTCLILSLLLFLPLAGGVVAEDFSVSDYVNPFSGIKYSETYFLGDGKIDVLVTGEYDKPWKEITADDFPLLDIEAIENYGTSEEIFIILKDKSDKAIVEAMDILYNNYRGIVGYAFTCDSYYYSFDSLGDVNLDHSVNLSDASLLLKHIAGWDVFVYSLPADITRDSKLNIDDVTNILKKAAGWKSGNWYII